MGRLRLPRETTAQITSKGGAEAEIAYDTTADKLSLRDATSFKFIAKEQDVPTLAGVNKQSTYAGRANGQTYWFFAPLAVTYTHTGGEVEFDSVRTNSRGFSTTTHRFTAPVTGLYMFGASLWRTPASAYANLDFYIRNNSTSEDIAGGFYRNASATNDFFSANCTGITQLTQGQTVSVHMASTHELGGEDYNQFQTYFYGYLI